MLQVEYLFLFCALFLYTTCEGGVFKEYDQNQSRDGQSNYYLSTLKVSYSDALQMCNEKDMQLVSIETYEKNKQIYKLLLNASIDEPVWTSGIKNLETGATNWLKGEHLDFDNIKNRNTNLNCIEVSILNGLIWNWQHCSAPRRFVCEKLPEEVKNPKCEDYSDDLVHGNTLSNKKYYFGRETITYSKALQVCRSMCMRLVSIENEEKNKDLFEVLVAADTSKYFWTSGHFKPGDEWKWTNGKVADFFSWSKGEPNNANPIHDEYCIEMFKNDEKLVWNDIACEYKRMYICETIDNENNKA